jgi:hypothetical protein
MTKRQGVCWHVQVVKGRSGLSRVTGLTWPDPLPHDIAAGLIRTWLRFKLPDNSVPIMTGTLKIRAAHGYLIGTPSPVRSGARNCVLINFGCNNPSYLSVCLLVGHG